MRNRKVVFLAKGLRKTYKNGELTVNALQDLNMEIREGEMLSIMGTSGSGKSTLLNIIGALDSPTDGKFEIDGKESKNYHIEPNATKYRSNNIGFIFQSYNLLKDLSVEENIALPLILKGEKENAISQKVNEYIQLVGLAGRQKHRPVELSGGQQQRVAIARALVTSPKLLLADEPTGNLDYNTSTEILNTIKELKERLNQSIVIATHDPKVSTYADRVLFLKYGKIVDEYEKIEDKGDIDEILNKVKRILGD